MLATILEVQQLLASNITTDTKYEWAVHIYTYIAPKRRRTPKQRVQDSVMNKIDGSRQTSWTLQSILGIYVRRILVNLLVIIICRKILRESLW